MNGYAVPSTFYRVSVKALVFDPQDRLLVMQNRDDTWELPGGGWEHGETLEECLRRELLEELGVGIASIDMSTIHPCVGHAPDARYPWLKLALNVELASQDFALDARMRTTRYVTRAEFQTLTMHRSEQSLQDNAVTLWGGRASG
jgi:8-oxo-dGTP pyrophosphatase MutT (NUDIX family)